MSGRVTVVVITHNRRAELCRTLAHMAALSDRAPIIVVDNGSGDGSATAVARDFPEVELLASPRNLGAIGRNLAVERVRTPYVAFCDDDTCWEPGSLTRAADLLDENPELGSVTGRCLVEPGLREDPITPEMRHSPVPGPDWLPGPALLGIMAGLSMVRVSAFRDVGGFSPRLWLGGEEELFALDLAARGWWMCWAEDVVIRHAPSRARDPRARRADGIRNTLWTAWLRRPLRSAVRHTAWVLRGAPKDRATAGAVGRALLGLPWVLAGRRVVPAEVESGLRLLEAARVGRTARNYVG
ncbi:putative transferase [Actinokineospora spheciospongiae]|uniref:Putative transferase n=1 Tax=Actinokineospora spheciospongiae TaxID=909613 RepID=W7J2N2_9PSEU|nr:glycosyltransferase [Actinokineospora spheciospongiae]EWC63206.1 putative transferase [Actinokineospora spheciospongiae]PWW66962.1 GT2 family glycosyltransferase [Actinokineospora spheciospongiae]